MHHLHNRSLLWGFDVLVLHFGVAYRFAKGIFMSHFWDCCSRFGSFLRGYQSCLVDQYHLEDTVHIYGQCELLYLFDAIGTFLIGASFLRKFVSCLLASKVLELVAYLQEQDLGRTTRSRPKQLAVSYKLAKRSIVRLSRGIGGFVFSST